MVIDWNTLNAFRGRNSTLLLLAAAVFLFSQSLALSHIHVDDEPTASCVVCHHADNNAAIDASSQVATASPACDNNPVQFASETYQRPALYDHLSRAPPANG